MPDAGDRIAVIWFDGDVKTEAGTGTGLDSVFTGMYLLGNGTLLNPLTIDTMYTASKAYVDNSIAEAGAGDITGVNESPQYGINGGGASGAILLSADTTVLASKDYVNNSIAEAGGGDITGVNESAQYGILGGGASGAINLSADTSVLASKTYVVNEIPNNAVTSITAGNYLTGGTITSTGTINADATSTNTVNKLVARDASGNFSAGTITATLNGNASTATELQTGRTIAFGGDLSGSNTFDGSSNITISGQVANNSHTHVISNISSLQAYLDAKQDNLSGTGIVKSTGGTISYLTDNSSNWTSAYNDKITSASVTGTTTKTITLTQQDGGNITAQFDDLGGNGSVTAINAGNNRLPVFDTGNTINGGSGFWINNSNELVDNLLDGTAPNPIGYQLKLSHTAFIDSIVTNDITMQGNLVLDNNLEVLGSTTFDGTVGDSYFYPSGALGIQTTPSGNLSLTTKYGATFNTDNNSNYGDVTMNGATTNNLFNLDASLDAIAIGGATPNSSYDLKTSKGVWINSSYGGGVYDGLLVSGDTDIYLLNVDADRDKIGVNKFQPNYTLDVDGDINFTDSLRHNGTAIDLTAGIEQYSFSLSMTNNITRGYVYFPAYVNGCQVVSTSLSGEVIGCSSCGFDFDIGTISSGTFSGSTYLASGLVLSNGAFFDSSSISFTISNSANVIEVSATGTVTSIPSFNANFLVTCN
tara:strand:- start:859 stop:2967 length:2109 start_codon:yes stop_codon:yes gene_type:complete